MEFIKLARLKTGEDIISFTELGKSVVRFTYPVSVYIDFDEDNQQQELIMKFWLPINLIETNKATIPSTEILFFADPKQEFTEFYLNFLSGYENDMEENDKDQIKNLLDSLDAAAVNKLH
jgi:hypothetical protein